MHKASISSFPTPSLCAPSPTGLIIEDSRKVVKGRIEIWESIRHACILWICICRKGHGGSFLPDLRHEGQMYKLLRRVQGSATPVCLGNIDLKKTYYLDVGVRIIHVLLLS
jgi:hypothetical protein